MDNVGGSLLAGELIFAYEEPTTGGGNEKSTRISSLNSVQKINPNMSTNQNNTILSQNSSQSSQSYKNQLNQNVSKLSAGGISSQSNGHNSNQSQSHYVDLDLQGKGLKNFEIDFKQSYGDKKQLRSVNLAKNSLIKVPVSLEKSLQYLNLSFNKLKSLNGIESYVNLKFLNVQGNQISQTSNLVLLQSLREIIFANNQLSVVKDLSQLKNLNLIDLSFNKISEFEKLIPLQNLKKLTILSLRGNVITKMNNYDQVFAKMLPLVKVPDPEQIRDFSQFQNMEHVCFTDEPEQSSMIVLDQINQVSTKHLHSVEKKQEKMNTSELRKKSQTPKRNERDRSHSQLAQQQSLDQKLRNNIISPTNKRITLDSNASKNSTMSQKSQPQPPTPKQQVNLMQPQYNENQFKLQTKYSSTSLSKNQKLSTRNPPMGVQRERSYTNEEDKSQTRERSVSNISRNTKAIKTQQNSVPQSGRSTAVGLNQSQQNPAQALKEQFIKKVSVNVNLGNSYAASQGKLTPRRQNNVQTPRQEISTQYYKKSFCQTEDEHSIAEGGGTPSEKNTIRTAPTQESSDKKKIKNIKKREDLQISTHSPNAFKIAGKTSQQSSVCSSSRNSIRPVTTLKQRAIPNNKNDSLIKDYYQPPSNQTLIIPSSLVGSVGQTPQSTKAAPNYSNSFVFEKEQNVTGRITPTSSQQTQGISNRPSSSLQKFINARPQSQAQQAQQDKRQSQSSMLIQPIPSQKLTNLPPKSYQTRGGNPGDKKSQADMSLSMIQSNTSSQQKFHNSILQTGGTLGGCEEESKQEESSRSMSPVLEESNNIKKLRTDLTQFMNKQ